MKGFLLAALGLIIVSNAHAVAPLISDVADQNIAQGASTGTLFFTMGDAETTFTALTVSATAGDAALLPTLTLGGTNSQRSIAVTAAAGLTGTTTVTLTVTDGEALTASSTFQVTVTTANTKPTLTGLASHHIITPAQSTAALSFSVNDTETAAGALVVSATSSNTALVPNANLIASGSSSARTLQITPVSGQRGCAVIKVKAVDALGASAQAECVFSVFDTASTNNAIPQPRGLYVLDSGGGTQIGGVSMRDANVRNLPFVDGYVLRTDWAQMEPVDGQAPDFTIIDNIFTKLPANQKLSLIVSGQPAWLTTLPGITTWTGGTPSVTRPVPWDAISQERLRLFIVALGDHLVDGVPLRSHPRLGAVNVAITGLSHGIRDPEIKIRDIPGYSRANMLACALTHLANVTNNFPNVPLNLGFWAYTDSSSSPAAWDELRQGILAVHDGITRKRIGFWMENLAANRTAADSDPLSGLPNTSFAAALYQSQSSGHVGFQMLGSWSRPFNDAHVDNNLNGSPEDAMDYAFNTFQTRYFEIYQADADFAGYTAEFQRWHDFLTALPGPPISVTFGSSQGSTSLSAANGSSVSITLSASGGTAPYAWSIIGGAVPSGITLSSSGVLSGSSTQSGSHTITVQVTDATGGSASQAYTLLIEAPPSEPVWSASSTRNGDGSITLNWPTTAGAWYQIEVSDDLTHWIKLGSSTLATSGAMSWTDNGTQTGSLPGVAARRFYRVRDWGIFTVSFTSTTFTYTDAQRSVTGICIRPAGTARLPALIINHGTGGTANGFSLQRANEMNPWGLVCIGANLTHLQGATEDLSTWGHSPENLARIRACQAALSTRSDVDLNRLALWGHSRGAFASIGAASDFGAECHALGFSAGGIVEDSNLTEITYPSVTEASSITAPAIFFHGSTDTVVPPENSLRLQTLLNTHGVPNNRVLYDTTSTTPNGNKHNLHQVPAFNTDMLAQWHAWLITHGVLE